MNESGLQNKLTFLWTNEKILRSCLDSETQISILKEKEGVFGFNGQLTGVTNI